MHDHAHICNNHKKPELDWIRTCQENSTHFHLSDANISLKTDQSH